MFKCATGVALYLITLGILVGCSAASGTKLSDGDNSQGGAGGQGGITIGTGNNNGTGGNGASDILVTEPPCDNTPADADSDNDGFSPAQGDCNDCTSQMNPGAYDYAGNNIDEDCNGTPDDSQISCDQAIAVDSADPMDGARAMGLCKMQTGSSWGVVSAEYILPDGSPPPSGYQTEFHLGHGILDGFGPYVNPQEGSRMFAISSGTARQPTDPGYYDPGGYDKWYTSGAPPGYPKEFAGCPPDVITGEPHDSLGLRLVIRTPTNAKALHFNVNMYTWEFPVYICSMFNDFIVAMLTPIPVGQQDGNISFDTQGNPLSVNAGFLEVCTPQQAGGKDFPCTLGPQQLTNTGFEDHAATGWLQTSTSLVEPGANIEIMFAVWDSGDGILDTTGLFDNFYFDLDETPTVTQPVPSPK